MESSKTTLTYEESDQILRDIQAEIDGDEGSQKGKEDAES